MPLEKGLFFSTGGIHMATLMGMFLGLEENLEKVQHCGGISAGAFLATLCAVYDIDDIRSIISQHSHDRLLQNRHKYFNTIISTFFNKSILDDSNLKQLIQKLFANRELKRNLFVGVTEDNTMTYTVKHFEKNKIHDDLCDYVLGSMSIPIILPGVQHDKKYLVDGGLFHSIPVEAIDFCIQNAVKEHNSFEITLLSSRRFHAKMHQKTSKHFVIPNKAMRMFYSHGYQTMHNDQIILNKTIANAKEHGVDVKLNFFSIPDEKVDYYDKEIKFEEYGSLKDSTVNVLLTLGKSIVKNALFNNIHLKF